MELMINREAMAKGYSEILTRMNSPHPDLGELASLILHLLLSVLGGDRGEITLVKEEFDPRFLHTLKPEDEDKAVRLRAKVGYTEDQWKRLEESGVLLKSLIHALDKKESRVVPDTRLEEPADRALSEYLGNGSWMNHLLILEGKVMAKIHLAKNEPNHYKDEDLDHLKDISSLLATAINICSLWEKERNLVVNFINALNGAMELKDPYTAGHIERVKLYSGGLAALAGVSPERRRLIEVAAVLHDIGKIGIPDEILKKPGKLTPHEYQVIKDHVPLADTILKNLAFLEEARVIAGYHHEKMDGSGYVRGLSGSHIPFESRIIAVADAFDAMTSTRPYRKALFVEEAEGILLDPQLEQWDRDLVRTFCQWLHSKRFLEFALANELIAQESSEKSYSYEKSQLKFRNFSAFWSDLEVSC